MILTFRTLDDTRFAFQKKISWIASYSASTSSLSRVLRNIESKCHASRNTCDILTCYRYRSWFHHLHFLPCKCNCCKYTDGYPWSLVQVSNYSHCSILCGQLKNILRIFEGILQSYYHHKLRTVIQSLSSSANWQTPFHIQGRSIVFFFPFRSFYKMALVVPTEESV